MTESLIVGLLTGCLWYLIRIANALESIASQSRQPQQTPSG